MTLEDGGGLLFARNKRRVESYRCTTFSTFSKMAASLLVLEGQERSLLLFKWGNALTGLGNICVTMLK